MLLLFRPRLFQTLCHKGGTQEWHAVHPDILTSMDTGSFSINSFPLFELLEDRGTSFKVERELKEDALHPELQAQSTQSPKPNGVPFKHC